MQQSNSKSDLKTQQNLSKSMFKETEPSHFLQPDHLTTQLNTSAYLNENENDISLSKGGRRRRNDRNRQRDHSPHSNCSSQYASRNTFQGQNQDQFISADDREMFNKTGSSKLGITMPAQEMQIQSLNTMDQFANFLLQKQQSNEYSASGFNQDGQGENSFDQKYSQEGGDEFHDAQDEEGEDYDQEIIPYDVQVSSAMFEENRSPGYGRLEEDQYQGEDDEDQCENQDNEQEYNEEQEQQYDQDLDDENQEYNDYTNSPVKDIQQQEEDYSREDKNQKPTQQADNSDYQQTEHSLDTRREDPGNHEQEDRFRASPIRNEKLPATESLNMNISQIGKNELEKTPSEINHNSQFSPNTPMSQLNNLNMMANRTPKGHQFQQRQMGTNDSNFGEDYSYLDDHYKDMLLQQTTETSNEPASKPSNPQVFQRDPKSAQIWQKLGTNPPLQTNAENNQSDYKLRLNQQNSFTPHTPNSHTPTAGGQLTPDQQRPNSNLLAQYEVVLQQMNGQIQKLLARNQELEQQNISNELINQQQKQIIQELQATLQQEKLSNDQKLDLVLKQSQNYEIEIEKHKQILQIYSNELEIARQHSFELEQRLQLASQHQISFVRSEQDMKMKIDELTGKLRQLESYTKLKDDEIFKLRQDNHQMFTDLKELAQIEENLKMDLINARNQKREMDGLLEDMRARSQQQEFKIKQLSGEMDRYRKEVSSKGEQNKLFDIEMQSMRDENRQLRERLQIMEQERINLLNDKDRRERDFRNMQSELSRMNTMVNTYKNMAQQQQESKINQSQSELSNYYGGKKDDASPWMNKSVLKNSDQNQKPARTEISWVHGASGTTQAPVQNFSQSASQFNEPVKKQSNRDINDFSPVKKIDPNSSYAQRQKMMTQGDNLSHSAGVQPWIPERQQMNYESGSPSVTLQNLLSQKQKLENEYQKIPITISGKSLQMKKRKEELEFELDQIEKNINKIMLMKK